MNTTEVYGAYGAGLVLAALFVTAIAHGWVVITWNLSVKVVPPWQRKAPPPRKTAAQEPTSAATPVSPPAEGPAAGVAASMKVA
jgi:hypothetical protein